MHEDIYLVFDKYSNYTEPPAECWENLDNILRDADLPRINIECRTLQCNPSEPVVWGNWYIYHHGDEWLVDAKTLFPKAVEDGRLWAYDSRRRWHNLHCE